MAAFEARSVQYTLILKGVKDGEISSLFWKLQRCVDPAKDHRNGKLLVGEGEFLMHVLKHIHHYLSMKQDCNLTEKDLLSTFQSVEFCINLFEKHHDFQEIQQVCDGQYEKTLYHIIHRLIFQNDEYAFLLINRFKDYVQKSLKIAIGSCLFTYTNNLFSAIWNYLAKHAKFSANEIFQKRLLALQILSYDFKQLHTFGENSYYAIRMYCKAGKPEHQLISCFLQNVWSNIQEYRQECSDICVKMLMLRTTCRWLAATYKLIDQVCPDFLAILNFLKTLTQEYKCSHSMLVNIVSDIAMFCATFVPLKEISDIPDSTLTSWKTKLKKFKETPKDLKYISSVFSVFLALLEELLKLLANMEKVSNCSIVKGKLSALVCISSLYFEYLDTEIDQLVPDNRGYVITTMLQIIYYILLQENSANDMLDLLSFLNFFIEKFDIVSRNKKNKNSGLEGYVITLGKIAHHFMQTNSYKEAVRCLNFVIRGCEILLTEYTETCLSNIDCWKYHKLLVISYESMGLYNDALQVLVKGFVLKKEIELFDFEFWIKVKKNAYLANCREVIDKTVTDIFEEINVTVTQEKRMILLENELLATKKEKQYECIPEVVSVILQIMRSTCDSYTKALMLVELSQIGEIELCDYYPDINENSTPFSLCQEASEIFLRELENNPDNIFCKMRLSYTYFWMYVCKVNEIQLATSVEVEKECNKARKGSNIENNGEHECDKPAFFNVTTAFENKLFENLNNAINLWKEITHNLNKTPISIDNEVEKLNLLEVILTSAEIFWTSGNENQAVISWSLLHDISCYCRNNTYKLISLSSIASLAISQGYIDLAGKLIDLAENLISSLPERKSSNWAKFSLDCCKSVYFLHQENFTEGLKLLVSILETQVLKQNTRTHLVLKFEAKLVLAQYMLLNRSVFTENLFDVPSIPRDPITLINQSVVDCQQYLKVRSTEESRSLSWISWRQKITRLLFQNTVFESQLFLDMGSPCKAKFLLNEAIYMAQFLFHTYWASKLLIVSSYIDLICNDYKSCEVKLTGIEYILKSKEMDCNVLKTSACNRFTDSDEELDDSFLKTRSDIDFKTEVRLEFIKKFETMSLSPATHSRQKTVKSEIKNPFTCSCEQCLLCSVKFISLELGLLKCSYLMEKELQFDVTPRFIQLQNFLNQLTKSHTVIEKLPLFKDRQITGELFRRSMPKSHLYLLISIMLKQSVCNYQIKNVEHAMWNIYEAEGLLQQYAKTPTVSCPNLFAFITVHKVELCLKFLAIQTFVGGSKSPSKFSSVPISMNSEIYSTPECRKIPPINVANSFNKPTFISLNYAPIKKSILPADVQHGLDNNSPFTELPNFQSPSVFNLIHAAGEGKAFKTPLNPRLNVTPQLKVETKTCRRTRSTRSATLSHKGTENEGKSLRTKNYKFFTSKSQDATSINAAKDVWSSTQALDSVFALECSTPSKKSNRRNAKRNPPLKTKKTRVKTKSKAESQSSCNSNNSPEKNKVGDIKSEMTEHSVQEPFDTSAELFCSPTYLSDAIEETRKDPKSRVNKTSTRLNKKAASVCKTPSIDSTKRDVHSSKSRGKLLSVEMTLAENTESRTQMLAKNVETFKSSYTCVNSDNITRKLNKVREDEILLYNVTPKKISEKFISIFQKDLSMDELITCLKSSITAIEHRPPHPLYSELCKMLALLMMLNAKTSKNSTFPLDVTYLLSESFAVTLKNENVLCLDKKAETNMSQANKLSSAPKAQSPATNSCATSLNEMNFQLSKCITFSDKMQHLMSHLPVEWTVVQVCVIKDSFLFEAKSKQNLCICRYRCNSTPYIKLFNLNNCDLKTYLSEFDAIRHENTVSTKSKDPEQFWKLRTNLNHRLRIFVADMCSNWFGGWKGLFLGLPATQKRKDRIQEIIKKLPIPLPQNNDQEMLEVLVDTARSLSNEELSSVIDELWMTENDDDMHDSIFRCIRTETNNFKDVERHPVILIIDKDLQHLPWENMPINRNYPTVREPSLYFLHYQLLCHNQDKSLISRGIDSNSTFYLLNPHGDMKLTQESFQEIFSKEMSWAGISGKEPTPEEMQHAFTDYELVLYLGHGSGNNYFRNPYEVQILHCTASAVVMGCCSGSLKKPGPQMEATGDALRYYLGGCPCIVANLWEVTDKDIDLYTKSLLEGWLPNYNGKNIAKDKKLNIAAVSAKARNSCKLHYLNGAAPIVYGLPLFAKF